MRRRLAVRAAGVVLCSAFLTGAGVAAGLGAPATASAAAELGAPALPAAGSPGGTWGTAAKIPGIATLNKGDSVVGSVSCATSISCGAGGQYTSEVINKNPFVQAFVVSRQGGVWRKAEEAPGIATLNVGGNAKVTSVSCTAVGDCSAGGYYTDAAHNAQAFVINETSSTWGDAEEVPGLAALNLTSPAAIDSVSCTAVGDCSAGGYYADVSGHVQPFVVNETSGVWGTAEEVLGVAALNAGGYAKVDSVSCGGVGDCSAGGLYASSVIDGVPFEQAFVVTETDGTWGTAEEVPGTAALNGGGYAAVNSVSCAPAGNCSAGGEYTGAAVTEAFVVSETNGVWGTAEEVPGIGALNAGGLAQVNSVSCPAPGDCSVGGFYTDVTFNDRAFVVSETSSVWGDAEELPGFTSLDLGLSGGAISAVSCAAVGVCTASGSYTDAINNVQAFVANETGGSWGDAEELPGTAALNTGGIASTESVSCAPGGRCTAVGEAAKNIRGDTQAFAASEASR